MNFTIVLKQEKEMVKNAYAKFESVRWEIDKYRKIKNIVNLFVIKYFYNFKSWTLFNTQRVQDPLEGYKCLCSESAQEKCRKLFLYLGNRLFC